jgi:hypothetical protein
MDLEWNRVIWYAEGKQDVWRISQIADRECYHHWLHEMIAAHHLAGVPGMEGRMLEELPFVRYGARPRAGHVPVRGWRSRKLLRQTLTQIDHARTSLKIVHRDRDSVAMGYTGSRSVAMADWHEFTDAMRKSIVITLATQGMDYFVTGTQVGYRESTRHLFHRRNRFELAGGPLELRWRAVIDKYVVPVHCDWDELERVHQQTKLGLLQWLQLYVLDEIDRIVRKEN